MKALRVLLLFSILIGSLVSCSKVDQNEIAASTSLNTAEKYVQSNPEQWNGMVSQEFFDEYIQSQSTFPEDLLRDCLTPGVQIDTTLNARINRLRRLSKFLKERDAADVDVESIIQVNGNKRVIDASAGSVALVIANMGTSVAPQTSYDYLSSSLNRITTADLFLANWALQNTNVPGNFIVSDDDYLELVDGSLTLSTLYSGQNYAVEALILYNGPGTSFSYLNTISGTTESIFINSGELLSYGPETPLGELILNPTLENENYTGGSIESFIDARIVGPIPGGIWFTLQNGNLNNYL